MLSLATAMAAFSLPFLLPFYAAQMASIDQDRAISVLKPTSEGSAKEVRSFVEMVRGVQQLCEKEKWHIKYEIYPGIKYLDTRLLDSSIKANDKTKTGLIQQRTVSTFTITVIENGEEIRRIHIMFIFVKDGRQWRCDNIETLR